MTDAETARSRKAGKGAAMPRLTPAQVEAYEPNDDDAQAAADEEESPLCRVSGCGQRRWPTFDGVCFDHGMFPETVPP